MVFLAGHNKQMNPSIRRPHHTHQIIDQAFKNIELSCNAYVIHALRIFGAKTSAHAPRKQDSPRLSGPDCLHSCLGKSIPVCFDLFQLHSRQRSDNASLNQLFPVPAGFQNPHIRNFNLVKQFLLFLRGELPEIF